MRSLSDARALNANVILRRKGWQRHVPIESEWSPGAGFNLQKQDSKQADKAQGHAGHGKADSSTLLVIATLVRGTRGLAGSVGLGKIAIADVLALLELALVLERLVEGIANVTEIAGRLKVEHTLDVLQRWRRDPAAC